MYNFSLAVFRWMAAAVSAGRNGQIKSDTH